MLTKFREVIFFLSVIGTYSVTAFSAADNGGEKPDGPDSLLAKMANLAAEMGVPDEKIQGVIKKGLEESRNAKEASFVKTLGLTKMDALLMFGYIAALGYCYWPIINLSVSRPASPLPNLPLPNLPSKAGDTLSNKDIAYLISDQFDYLTKAVRSGYIRHPRNIFVAYVGGIDIHGISEHLKSKYRGGVKVMDAELAYQQLKYEDKMPLHTRLLNVIPKWIMYSLNWVLRRQSLLIIKDPEDMPSAVLAAYFQGEKHFDRTVTFMRPEILLQLEDNKLNIGSYIEEGLGGVLLISDGKLVKYFRPVRYADGYPAYGKCEISGSHPYDHTLGDVIFSFLHERNFSSENPFFLMGVDPVKAKKNKRQCTNPKLPMRS